MSELGRPINPLNARFDNLFAFSQCCFNVRPVLQTDVHHREIIILSCLGKLFTICINTRLTSYYCKSFEIIGNEQAGFRQGFSTTNHIFFLKTLIDLYLFRKKRLYCCFMDYNRALDMVTRAALWSKLLSKGIGGKIITSIYLMYNNAKSCISMSGKTS